MDYLLQSLKIIHDVKVGKGHSPVQSSRSSHLVAKPVIINPPPTMVDFDEYDEVILNCNASGYPKPTVLWFHNSTVVQANSRVLVLSNGSLLLREAVTSDVGFYVCLASSDNDIVTINVTLKLKAAGMFYHSFNNLDTFLMLFRITNDCKLDKYTVFPTERECHFTLQSLGLSRTTYHLE